MPKKFVEDTENPTITSAEGFRSLKKDMPEVIAAMKRARGQRGPQKAPTKERVTLRLDHAIVERFKKGGRGWQSRLNDALHEWVATQK